ncbi:MAG: asparagine synthase-related protein [Desulfobacteraceae bacterium]
MAIYGNPDRGQLDAMFKRIGHRGPWLQDIYASETIMMAQNYLEADVPGAPRDLKIFGDNRSDADLKICYDGQMGNRPELAARNGIPEGPLQEESLILHLYKQHGTDVFRYLNDAIFALVIADGDQVLAARDLLGIKTLFYGWKDGNLYLGSELKSLTAVIDEIYEFPPGCYMDQKGRVFHFAELPQAPPPIIHKDLDKMVTDIRDIIRRSVANRLDFKVKTGSLLSGGIDSSLVACLATQVYRDRFGPEARLPTFALGVGESQDISNARLVARHLNSDHAEFIVGLEEIVAVLPEVIYYLESFDPSLVRSSASNFLISRYAKEQGIEVLLSGEGGDEVFCGYLYLKNFPLEELFAHQMQCIGFLHSNASLRLDRMNQANSIRVVAPLISGELLDYSMGIPPEYKQKPEGEEKIEKWIFRKAFEDLLPPEVVWRLKQEFSQGSGSADVLPQYFEQIISDAELAETQARFPMVRSKEELYYFRIFTENFGSGRAVDTVGQWVCI